MHIFHIFFLLTQNILEYLLKLWPSIYLNIHLWSFQSLKYIRIFVQGGFSFSNIFEYSFKPIQGKEIGPTETFFLQSVPSDIRQRLNHPPSADLGKKIVSVLAHSLLLLKRANSKYTLFISPLNCPRSKPKHVLGLSFLLPLRVNFLGISGVV